MTRTQWQPRPQASTKTSWITRTARTPGHLAQALLHSQQRAVQSTALLVPQAHWHLSWCLGVSPQLRPGIDQQALPTERGSILQCTGMPCAFRIDESRSFRCTHTQPQESATHVQVCVILREWRVATGRVCVRACVHSCMRDILGVSPAYSCTRMLSWCV
jgi:hypothetical protein